VSLSSSAASSPARGAESLLMCGQVGAEDAAASPRSQPATPANLTLRPEPSAVGSHSEWGEGEDLQQCLDSTGTSEGMPELERVLALEEGQPQSTQHSQLWQQAVSPMCTPKKAELDVVDQVMPFPRVWLLPFGNCISACVCVIHIVYVLGGLLPDYETQKFRSRSLHCTWQLKRTKMECMHHTSINRVLTDQFQWN
jgi:hypothetical protein